ncbi:MAG: OsmC family protein [Sphaerochaetaceae bacterium]
MENEHIYETSLKWTENRKGVFSSVGMEDIEVATPIQFPGGHPNIWSPEHFYIGAAEICFMTTFLAIAEKSKLEFTAYESKAVGTLATVGKGLAFDKIKLYPKVTLKREEDTEKALKLLEKAERHCLISNSMKNEVTYEAEIVVG